MQSYILQSFKNKLAIRYVLLCVVAQTQRFDDNQAEQRKAKLAKWGQGQAVTSVSDTEEYIPTPWQKRKKVTKQPAAPAAIEVDENKEGDNKEAIEESSSEIMPEQSDTDDETDETDSMFCTSQPQQKRNCGISLPT